MVTKTLLIYEVSMLDQISDMLTRIRNAQMARKKEVFIPASNLKWAIAKILEERAFIYSAHKVNIENRSMIKVVLGYRQLSRTNRVPSISSIRRVSRQGQRRYIKSAEIKKVRNGYGVAIISTSQGVMTGEDAYRKGLGGEYICEVY